MQPETVRAGIVTCLLLLSCLMMAQSPGGIPNSSLWLKGNLGQKSDNADLLNFNPATTFNEESNLEFPHDIYQLGQATIFTVYKDEVVNNENTIWEMKGEFGDVLLSTESLSSASRNTKMAFSKDKITPLNAEEKSEAVINTYTRRVGSQQLVTDETTKPVLRFGHAASANIDDAFSGLIAEFILYERILKVEERTKLETYLALKYGITLEKDYRNSDGNIIWKKDSPYTHNVAGIARDDKATLYQKQATSSHESGQLVIGAKEIAVSNTENSATLNDGDYLIWGDNGQAFSLENVAENPMQILPKKWLMKASGRTANSVATQVKIDTKILFPTTFDKETFCLIIDRSATNLWTVETLEFIMPAEISPEGIATFNNVLWDTDNSGKDIFSFGLKPNLSEENQVASPLVFNKEEATKISTTASLVTTFQEYPNPTLDGSYNVNVVLEKATNIEIQVFDMHQRLLNTQKGEGQSQYQFSGFINSVPGVYTIMLITPEEEISRKIIVE